MNTPFVFKKCNKCGRWLVASTVNFHKNKEGKYGLKAQCKECHSAYMKKYNKKYNKEHKEEQREYKKKYNKEHKEEKREYNKKYNKTPQGQAGAFNRRNRRRKREEQQGEGITGDQWLEMMNFFDWKCAYSGEYIGGEENQSIRSIDHIIPLAKGGAHKVWNCVPMYRPFNSSKNDKDIKEWYPQQDFYDEDRLNKIKEWCKYAYNKWGKEVNTKAI